jgi:MacB-like periplasmic core domain
MVLPEAFLSDLRYGARRLSHNAGSTCVTVLALAIGIGVNTTVFTAYKAMVARPLDARAPHEMVNLALLRSSGTADYTFSYSDYETYRDSVRSFRGLIAFRMTRMTLANAGGLMECRGTASSGLGGFGLFHSTTNHTEFVSVFVVSENYFQVLGIKAIAGRTFDSMSIRELRHCLEITVP